MMNAVKLIEKIRQHNGRLFGSVLSDCVRYGFNDIIEKFLETSLRLSDNPIRVWFESKDDFLAFRDDQWKDSIQLQNYGNLIFVGGLVDGYPVQGFCCSTLINIDKTFDLYFDLETNEIKSQHGDVDWLCRFLVVNKNSRPFIYDELDRWIKNLPLLHISMDLSLLCNI